VVDSSGVGSRSAGTEEEGGRAQATQDLIEDTAVRMVLDQGVLAGLNLQDLADRAGVNRGLIYHYYGSRGALLRQAFQRRIEGLVSLVGSAGHLPLGRRMQSWLHGAISHATEIRLGALLLIDANEPPLLMPRRHDTQRELARDVADGHLDPSIDRNALNAFLGSALYGYAIFREPFASELGLPVEQLDKRIGRLLDRIVAGLAP